ncbi:MAG: hypothetical protein ACJAZQ_003137, partial [Cognaticolwellia sp.]
TPFIESEIIVRLSWGISTVTFVTLPIGVNKALSRESPSFFTLRMVFLDT